MKNDTPRESIRAIIVQAALWLMLLKGPKEFRSVWIGLKFLLWAVRSPRHVYEFWRLWRCDVLLTRALSAERRSTRRIDAGRPRGSSSKAVERQRRLEVWGWNATRAAVLIVSVLCSVNRSNDQRPGAPSERRASAIVTAEGALPAEEETWWRTLPEGTRVGSAAHARLGVAFTATRRDLHMTVSAQFEIAPDPRPMFVNTPWAQIHAHDDAKFAMTVDDRFGVSVKQGIVDLVGLGAGAQARRLKAGDSFSMPIDRPERIVADRRDGARVRIEG